MSFLELMRRKGVYAGDILVVFRMAGHHVREPPLDIICGDLRQRELDRGLQDEDP
jgi:hypothetical protein